MEVIERYVLILTGKTSLIWNIAAVLVWNSNSRGFSSLHSLVKSSHKARCLVLFWNATVALKRSATCSMYVILLLAKDELQYIFSKQRTINGNMLDCFAVLMKTEYHFSGMLHSVKWRSFTWFHLCCPKECKSFSHTAVQTGLENWTSYCLSTGAVAGQFCS